MKSHDNTFCGGNAPYGANAPEAVQNARLGSALRTYPLCGDTPQRPGKPGFRRFPKVIVYFFTIVLALSFTAILPACFNNKTPEKTYFSIDYTLGTQPKYDSPKYNANIVIQNMTSALAYDRQEIVYRNNPYEFQYYWYRVWASKPRKMLRELITTHLRYTQMFTSVSTTIEDRLPDYMLNIDILSIEELDVSETEWYAHLALQFTLLRSSDNHNVWSYEFDAKRPVASNQPVYVVKAMSELLNDELVKAFEDMDKKLSKHASHKPVEEKQPEITTVSEEPQMETEFENQPKAKLKGRK